MRGEAGICAGIPRVHLTSELELIGMIAGAMPIHGESGLVIREPL